MKWIAFKIMFGILLALPLASKLMAQSCGTDDLRNTMLLANPQLQLQKQQFDSLMLDKVYLNPPQQSNFLLAPIYTIPVVFHVVHNNGPENISDSLILAGLDLLNDAMAHRNLFDSVLGVDTQIQFCLAQQDENGDSAYGITRHLSTITNLSYINDADSLFSIGKWDGTKFLNIYIVNYICMVPPTYSCFNGLGYYPTSHGQHQDGIIITGSSFTYPSALFAHEVGHYLGLYHTFENGCTNNDCRADGDHVCDTPPDGLSGQGGPTCFNTYNSCNTDTVDPGSWNPYRSMSLGGLGDQPDKERNIMDYTSCQYEFTQGQKDRMIAGLTLQRASLLNSTGCLPGCSAPVTPAFAMSDTTILAGDSIIFTNASIGATQFQWYIDGLPFSHAQDTVYHIYSQGDYLITMCGANSDVSCQECTTRTVHVDCAAASNFSLATTTPLSTDTVFLTNLSTGASHFEWWIDGSISSTAFDTSYTFPAAGYHHLMLIATDGICRDSMEILLNVRCAPAATFQILGDAFVPPGAALSLHNTSPPNLSSEWYFDDTPLGFGNDTTLTQSTAFASHLWLRTFNGLCYDSSAYHPTVQFADCVLREANDWVCGTSNHIEFDSVPPAGLTNFYAAWGNNTSASDVTGKMLFFTSGPQIYNRFMQVMPNGSAIVSNASFYPQMIALRLPGSANRYFLFHTNSNGNLYLTEVDMEADQGRGDVVRKNVVVQTNFNNAFAIVQHANGRDYWVVGQSSVPNWPMTALLVSDTGLSTVPVLSPIPANGIMPGTGDIRFSPDGKKLAAAYFANYPIKLYDFDNASGHGSFLGNLSTDSHGSFSLSFSPGSTKLYYANQTYKQLWQYDMTLGSTTAISASRTLVGTTTGAHMAGLQIGADGNLYVGRWSGWLGAVRNPEGAGAACQYTPNGIALQNANATTGWNLPRFPDSYLRAPEAVIWGPASLCGASTLVTYNACNFYEMDSVWWEGLGAATLVTDSGAWSRFDFGPSGYAAVVTHKHTACGTFSDTMTVTLQPAPDPALGPDTLVCNADSLVLQAISGMTAYIWQDNSTSQTFVADSAGSYFVQVSNASGCIGRDTILILGMVAGPPSVQLPQDSVVCPSFAAILDPSPGQNSYLWQNNDTTPTFQVTGPGIYTVAVTDVCGRTVADTVVYQLLPLPALDLGPDTTLCVGLSLPISNAATFSSYLWSNGSTNATITASTAGFYGLLATDGCGRTQSDSVQLSYAPLPTVDLGNDTTICPGNGIMLDAGAGFVTYAWSNAATTQQISPTQQGNYSVTVTDACNFSATDAFILSIQQATPLDLGPDQVLCAGTVVMLTANATYSGYTWSDGSNGSNLNVTQPAWVWLEVIDDCAVLQRDSILLSPDSTLAPYLGADTSICPGQTIVLDPGSGFATYQWQNASQSQTLSISTPGTYWVLVSSPAACQYTDTVVVDLCVALAPELPSPAISLYPNPTTGACHLQVLAPGFVGAAQWEVTDVLGRIVCQGECTQGQGTYTADFTLAATGTYIVTFHADGLQRMLRLVVQ